MNFENKKRIGTLHDGQPVYDVGLKTLVMTKDGEILERKVYGDIIEFSDMEDSFFYGEFEFEDPFKTVIFAKQGVVDLNNISRNGILIDTIEQTIGDINYRYWEFGEEMELPDGVADLIHANISGEDEDDSADELAMNIADQGFDVVGTTLGDNISMLYIGDEMGNGEFFFSDSADSMQYKQVLRAIFDFEFLNLIDQRSFVDMEAIDAKMTLQEIQSIIDNDDLNYSKVADVLGIHKNTLYRLKNIDTEENRIKLAIYISAYKEKMIQMLLFDDGAEYKVTK